MGRRPKHRSFRHVGLGLRRPTADCSRYADWPSPRRRTRSFRPDLPSTPSLQPPRALRALPGFPDLDVTIEDQIAEGDKVVTRWSAKGTNSGPLQGMPPTGKAVRVTGANVARLAGGKIVESWFNFDMLTLLRQLGVVPTPGQAGG
jgi:hypothetical protein